MNASFFFPATIVAAGLLLGSCSPALNWRQVAVPGASLSAYFPCRPDHVVRRLTLVAQAVDAGLSSCSASALTFAIMAIDLQKTSRVDEGQQELRQLAVQNFGGQVESLPNRTVSGHASPQVAQQFGASLERQQGRPLQARMLLFSRGSWVFQATVMGEQLPTEVVDFFFDNL